MTIIIIIMLVSAFIGRLNVDGIDFAATSAGSWLRHASSPPVSVNISKKVIIPAHGTVFNA